MALKGLYVREILLYNKVKVKEAHVVGNDIAGSMKWIKENGIEYINFNTAHGWMDGYSIDFVKDYPWIKGVWLVTKGTDITPLNYLPNLERYGTSSQNKNGFLDFKNVPKLKELTFKWNPKLYVNFSDCRNLKCLNFYSPPYDSLEFVSIMPDIEILEIYKATKLETLKGLEQLKYISRLKLYSVPKLTNISSLKFIAPSLKKLSFELARKVEGFEVLDQLTNLESFYIYESAPIHSIQFLKKLKNLKYAYIGTEVLDGDVAFLEEKGIEYKKLKKYKSS